MQVQGRKNTFFMGRQNSYVWVDRTLFFGRQDTFFPVDGTFFEVDKTLNWIKVVSLGDIMVVVPYDCS